MSTSHPYHHGDLASAILTTARRLLDEVPVDELSIRELAREAQVSHAAPYRHFGSKAGFRAALTAHCFGEFLERQRRAYAAAAPGQGLIAVGGDYVAFGVEHPHVFALIYPHEPAQRGGSSDLAALADAHAALLGRCVADAFDSGLVTRDADPADVGAALWSLAHGLTLLAGHGYVDTQRVPTILTALLQS